MKSGKPNGRVTKQWRELLCSIPGYDPFADAGQSWFDPEKGQKPIDFFAECLTHVKGALANKPFKLERWQQAIVANLFGWQQYNEFGDVVRRYRKVFILVPRKNGKTPTVAGILLYVLNCDGEPGAEIYGAAADYSQASLLFEHARGMTMQDDSLLARTKIFNGQTQRSIATLDGLSSYRVISAEAFTKHGYNTHAFVIDELHTQPGPELVDTLETSMGARRQPLAIYITTADYEHEGSICNEMHDYARAVRDGIKPDRRFLPVIYEALPDENWHDQKVWKRVNPNLGVSISLSYLQEEHQKAVANPRFENTFRRLYLNTRTSQDTRWIPLSDWDLNGTGVDLVGLEGQECYSGLDIGATRDLTAFVMLFGNEQKGYDVVPYFWIPEENIEERSKRYRVDYGYWVNAGFIETTPGNVTDYSAVRARLNELAEMYGIREIGIDRLFQGAQLSTDLQMDGFNVVTIGQGFLSMAAPTVALERLILGRKLRHGGNPVLRWMFDNVQIETDAAGNIKPSKKKARAPIDGIVATIMALSRAMVATGPLGGYTEQATLRTVMA